MGVLGVWVGIVVVGGVAGVVMGELDPVVPVPENDKCLRGTFRNVAGAQESFVSGCPGFSLVPAGRFAPGDGTAQECPGGTFSATSGALECAPCKPGYFCDPGSTSATQHKCADSAAYFCPAGSSSPTPVSPGFFSKDGALQLPCPKGAFCEKGVQYVCPAGWYCADEGLSAPSGQCSAGYYCPAGSVSPKQRECGDETVYCPAGSVRPMPVSTDGRSSKGEGGDLSGDSARTRIGTVVCPPGFYCPPGEGMRRPCPAGRYGSVFGMLDSACEGECEAGYVCPPGSSSPRQQECGGSKWYCPQGSGERLEVMAGRYAVGGGGDGVRSATAECPAGWYCEDGVTFACPAGRYSAEKGLSDASECVECPAGYYCPIQSTSPSSCGDPSLYCPAGSAAPITAPAGWFTIQAVSAAQSSGEEEQEDGVGVFAGGGGMVEEEVGLDSAVGLLGVRAEKEQGESVDDGLHRTDVVRAPRGHYAVGDGSVLPCPQGRYGAEEGLTSEECSGVCEAGYLCPSASVSPTQQVCGGVDRYCTEGSWEAVMVEDGWKSVGGKDVDTRTGVEECSVGSWCVGGVETLCPAGRFGNETGLSDPLCSGICERGYFCLPGATTPTQHPCGGAGYFCPQGSGTPRPVSPGFYTAGGRTYRDGGDWDAEQPLTCARLLGRMDGVRGSVDLEVVASTASTASLLRGPLSVSFNASRRCEAGAIGDAATRSAQLECPSGFFCPGDGWRYECFPGRYGSSPLLTDPQCTGPCEKGFVCPWRSTSPRQVECGGADRYCPPSSAAPTPVTPGYYTTPNTPPTQRYEEIICPSGRWCSAGVKHVCPEGRFGATEGLQSIACSGVCRAGFFCPAGSIRADQVPCGNSTVYCPAASSTPLLAPLGTYTTGGFHPSNPSSTLVTPHFIIRPNTTRTSFSPCPIGHYCGPDRVLRQCPAGRFGNAEELSDPACSGPCAPGHFCPPGSTSPTEFRCGDVFVAANLSTNSTANITSILSTIPLLDLTPEERNLAVAAAQVAAARDASAYTLGGAAVGAGSEGVAASGATLGMLGARDTAFELPWEAGLRLKLPRVTFDLPSTAHTHALRVEGSPNAVFCPIASGWPKLVLPGFTTKGGNPTGISNDSISIITQDLDDDPDTLTANYTRVRQEECPKGFFCVAGIQHKCPPGTFGNHTRLTTRFCSGTCPQGTMCPLGSVIPTPCLPGTYAPAGAHVCIPCPGNSAQPDWGSGEDRCVDSRRCCDQ